MKTVYISKSHPYVKTEPTEDLTLIFTNEVQAAKTLEEMRVIFEKEGKTLFEALVNVLPGGTLDQLIAELLRYRASLFIVSFGDK